MYQTKIIGTGSCHPEKIVTNHDLTKMMDTSDEWIKERTGISQRRVIDPSKNEFPSVMAKNATFKALEMANIDKNEIDLILYSITYSEQSFPNTASLLQHELGLENHCPCLDINAACTGFAYGIELTDQLIRHGKYKTILLIGCDVPSAFVNWEDRNTAVLFGDGCGAVLFQRAQKDDPSDIHLTKLSCDSNHAQNLALTNNGIKNPLTAQSFEGRKYPHNLYMDGQVIFKNAVKTMSELAMQVLDETKINKDQIDWFIPHQANIRIIEALARRFEFPMEKVITNIAEFGNTSSATIPTALDQAIRENKIKRGDKILFTSFGSGLTSAAAVMTY